MKFLKVALFLITFSWLITAGATKRVLILYSTGGHATAARSVEELLNQYPEEFEVIRHDFSDDLKGFAKWFYAGGGYDFISRHASWINKFGVLYKWNRSENIPQYASERFNAKFNQPKNILPLIEQVKPDVIISTHFSVSDTLALLREQGYLKNIPIAWTHLDMVDNTFFRQLGDQFDMTFLPTKEMKSAWAQVISPEKLAAVGIPIIPKLLTWKSGSDFRDPVLLSELRLREGLNPVKQTVLLMGGSMGALSYEKIIREISASFARAGGENIQIIAVCGRNKTKAAELEAWHGSANFPNNVSLRVTGFIDQEKLRNLQNASDLIISKPGGLTTFELLTTEKPVIMAGSIGIQEQFNAKYVQKEGAALYASNINGIGAMVYSVLRGDPSIGERLITNQKRLKENFDLPKIVEWTRSARVLQPERPETPILLRQRALEKRSRESLREIGTCEQVFIFQ
jgi:processive 1,2-diacylglycerol beta-glucosyltransferase